MRFNMGCGHNRIEGYINVDASAACGPDQVFNLETSPWPWADNCATEILFNHSMEHMGAEVGVFMNIIKETYRIAAPGAMIRVNVPHPRHDNFLGDPTHVRAITPELFALFNRELNDQWKLSGAANSPLAHYTGVDLVLDAVNMMLAEPYRTELREQRITPEALQDAIKRYNNVIEEFQMRLTVRK
jgi:hypothetical protein